MPFSRYPVFWYWHPWPPYNIWCILHITYLSMFDTFISTLWNTRVRIDWCFIPDLPRPLFDWLHDSQFDWTSCSRAIHFVVRGRSFDFLMELCWNVGPTHKIPTTRHLIPPRPVCCFIHFFLLASTRKSLSTRFLCVDCLFTIDISWWNPIDPLNILCHSDSPCECSFPKFHQQLQRMLPFKATGQMWQRASPVWRKRQAPQ